MVKAFTAVAHDILQVRTMGVVSLHIRPRNAEISGSDGAVMDTFVQHLGFRPLHKAWIAISREQAEMLVLALLARDLAYGAAITDLDTASGLAARFIACFANDAHCYTNGTWCEGDTAISPFVTRGPSWTPITPATFDAGVICLDADNIGIFWVQDED